MFVRLAFMALAVLSALIGILSLRFLWLPLAEVMDHMAHYLPQARLAMYGHIVFGPLALLLAPVQLSQTLRARWPRFHRWSGYASVVAIAIAAPSVLAMLPTFLGTADAALGFACMSVLWFGFTARGVMRARRGDLAGHRRDMSRALAMTFAAISLRLIMAPLIAQGWSVTETYRITAWASWVPQLALVQLWLTSFRGRAPKWAV